MNNKWKEVKLGNVSKIYDGTHQTPKYKESGIPFYSVEHVTSNDFTKTRFISEDVYNQDIKKTKIEKGDILMTRIGDVGTAKYIYWEPKASFYVSLALIKCTFEHVNPKYITFLINSVQFKKEIWSKTIHVAFPNKINLGDIGKLKILLPPLPEQTRIVSVLETWDSYLENLNKKIEIKKNIKKGLMQKLLTGKARLKDFQDKWRIIPLKNIALINPLHKKIPNSFIYIDLESVEKGYLKKENLINKIDAPSRAQRVLEKQDIIFQTVRPYQKNNYYFNKDGNYIASTGYAQIRAHESSEYLYHYLHTDKFVNKVLEKCTGSNYPAINSTDLGKIAIYIPSHEEQKAIAEILTKTDKEIETLEKKRKLVLEQKKFLLNNLLTGNIRLPEFRD